jgi:hypothetical protein
MTHGSVRLWLRAEGLAVFAVSVWLYSRSGAGWPLFAWLILVPDLSILGYLAGPRAGAVSYNAVHSYVAPLALGLVAGMAGQSEAYAWLLIWTAHIGFDRFVGYGLKYPAAFPETHLGRIGRKR